MHHSECVPVAKVDPVRFAKIAKRHVEQGQNTEGHKEDKEQTKPRLGS